MEGMKNIDLTQDRDRWPGPVNAVMNLWFPTKCEVFLDYLRNFQLLKGCAPWI
jgi:hypothetical protein